MNQKPERKGSLHEISGPSKEIKKWVRISVTCKDLSYRQSWELSGGAWEILSVAQDWGLKPVWENRGVGSTCLRIMTPNAGSGHQTSVSRYIPGQVREAICVSADFGASFRLEWRSR